MLSTDGGAAILLYFRASSFSEAFRRQCLHVNEPDCNGNQGLLTTLGATLAVSLLNPHVYLDTVVMLGTISANFPGQGKYVFGLGAASASITWFLSLSITGRLLAPIFKNPKAWQVLHLIVTATVWWVAYSLIHGYISGSLGSWNTKTM